ncbi:unnamed protein product [Oikopleura dioica]|uniref:Uncharacterized protein n=1 Tax=Oikopleura dioica TaxID=34765 RepID=E4WYX5_OIKDI|nr:unnamed protein product [Oikopleura dioica]
MADIDNSDLLSVCTEVIDKNYDSGAKNLELAIQEFIKGTEKDIKKRNFDKKIATTCAEKFLDRAKNDPAFNGKNGQASVLAEEFGRAAVESINHLQEFQAAMKRIGEILAE